MPNMTYCQFQNTSRDFEQCVDAIGNADSISDFSSAEQSAADSMYEMAKNYVEWYEQLTQE